MVSSAAHGNASQPVAQSEPEELSTPKEVPLPDEAEVETEHKNSMAIFFILFVIG